MRNFCLAALLALSAPYLTAESPLDARIKAEIAKLPEAKVSLMAKNLDTGAVYESGADDLVRTASTIKLPIMVECFAQAAAGKLQFTDELPLTRENRVNGSGILTEFTLGLKLPLQDVLHLMIVLSDNTATNLILDKVTADAVNARMDTLGLRHTRCLRKVMSSGAAAGISKFGVDPANKKYGLGVTTPRDMVTLLEKLEKGEVVSAEASREMLAVLKRQQYREGIPRSLPDNVTVANKTGALDHLRSDVGIVYTPRGRIAIAITVEDIPEVHYSVDNPGVRLISRLSDLLIEGLGR